MEEEEVKLFTDIFEKESIPAKMWRNWKWKSVLNSILLGFILSLLMLAVVHFVYQKVTYGSFIYVIAGNITGVFVVFAIKTIRWNWDLLCRYRYKIYAYSLLVGVAIVFFRQELILLYDLFD